MSATTELPEYQIFTILRDGEEEPIGPYSQNEIVELLNQGEVTKNDLVFYDALGEWKKIKEVFNIHEGIANFHDDGQDQAVVATVFMEVTKILQEGENIYYIAVQDKPGLRITSPDAVVVTDYRLLYVHHKLTGKRDIDIYTWSDVQNSVAKMSAAESTGTFSLLLNSSERIEFSRIPKAQLQRLAQLSRELRSTEQAL